MPSKAVHSLGPDVDQSQVPGTIRLVDLHHNDLETAHAANNSDIILIPVPSKDPNDPLNWSLWRKRHHLICLIIYVFFNGMACSIVYSVLVPLSNALDVTIGDINTGTGFLFLSCGWGLLFWQPFALQYGKRLTYLVSMLGVTAVSIWSPYCKGNAQWMARNVILGFVASPIEALPQTSITDIYFAHERGTYMGWYAWVLATSNYFAPVICGFINDKTDYQWPFFIMAIFVGASFIYLFLFLEETNYDRCNDWAKLSDSSSHPSPPAPDGLSTQSDDKTLAADGADLRRVGTPVVLEGTEKTFLQKLSLLEKPRPFMMHQRAWRIMRLISWPIVFFSGFAYGTYLIWFNILNATASVILSGEPYNFKPSFVGLSYLACCLGVIIGSAYSGIVSDWFVIWLTRRNGGIYEPEQRLWLFSLTTVLVPASLILWGVGAAHQIHWFGLMFAMVVMSACSTAGITLSVSYLVDSFHDISDDSMASIIIIRNTMSFAIGYGITPWLDNLGVQNCFISVAFVALGICSVFWPMIVYGKKLRSLKRESYWREVHLRREKTSS